ncbi:MAG TPA: hypothetical protein VKD71_06130 [Gemmataceae bacterium]|nr:hypothetical protein [Gemmataceae bacterium]
MAGRRSFTWPTLAIVLAVVATTPAPAVDILRLRPTVDGTSPLAVWADDVYTWSEGNDQVFVVGGSVLIQQDQTHVWSNRAVLWVDADAYRKHKPFAVTIYADENGGKPVRIESKGRPREEVQATILEFVSPQFGWVRGHERQESLADSAFYKKAAAARGKTIPLQDNPPAAKGSYNSVAPIQFTQPGADLPVPKTPARPGDPSTQPPAVTGSTVIPLPLSETRTIWISPRTNRPFNVFPSKKETEKETAYIITGGIKLLAKFTTGSIRSMEVEADQAIVWRKEGGSGKSIDAMFSEEGERDGSGVELYLSGNVVIRYSAPKDTTGTGIQTASKTLRAERMYYDVSHHKAIALNADLEYMREGYVNAGHILAEEFQQLSSTEFTALIARMHASRLPSDPGFVMNFDRADVYKEPQQVRTGIFGNAFRNRLTGEIVEEEPEMLEATNIQTDVWDVPFLWWPWIRTDANDPLGPFRGITFRQDRVFGFQTLATWDMLKLVGLTRIENERWTLLTDYLSRRGPAIGTNYNLSSQKLFGTDYPFQTMVKGYAISDGGTDILSGPRSTEFQPTAMRGRFLFRHIQDFGEDITAQAQFSYLSDRNFLEQYYKFEYDYGPNQETFLWLKYQHGNLGATFLVEPEVGQKFATQTLWLPRADGYLLGQSLLDRFTYHTWASAAYARLDPFRQPPREFPLGVDNGFPPPEFPIETGRFDWMQRISAPFDVGPVRVAPYGVLDLAYYTKNVNGDQQGRVYGGGGVKASVPLSKLYPDIQSELFNVDGLYHKNLFSANYFIAGSNTSWAVLPELDRLNDDAAQSAWQDVTPWQSVFAQTAGAKGLALQVLPQFNPRLYAIRRLADSKVDTLDDIQVAQFDWRQRWQTKRGYPGLEHTVDWLTLDLSASVFPAADRDNFGNSLAFLEWSMVWNVGDRDGLYSNGWVDPFDFGARYWEVGTFFTRDDRTLFAISYRHTDPLASRVVSVSATYVFSPKYAMTAITAYDLGYSSAFSNTLLLTRVGTDLQVTLGFTYNSLINTFGVTFNVVPNLLASQATPVPLRGPGATGGAQPYQGR